MKNSKIEWTHHTFNPWMGCEKVSAACDNCYAEQFVKNRMSKPELWNGERQRTRPANWKNPIKWNKDAVAKGIRYRVFCASLADVFDNQVPKEWRYDLWQLIRATPQLDWLLLTKRPQNIYKMLPNDWGDDGYDHVWLGTTVEDQTEANRRIPHLIKNPAPVHFLSCEPLLGSVDLTKWPDLDWVILGGESGGKHRHTDDDWYRNIRDHCVSNDIPVLFKQYEGRSQVAIKKKGRELDGVVWDQYPQVAA